jgi:cell division protein FtsI (penicillin-binding protein 3)
MTYPQRPTFIPWRFNLLLIIIYLAVIGLICRVLDLAIFDKTFLQHQSDERVLRLVSTPSYRGMIFDRNGYPLAVSTTVYSIWVNPKEFTLTKEPINMLSKALAMSTNELRKIITSHQKKSHCEFAYIKRGMSPEVASKVKALGLAGIYTQEEFRRFYPEGDAAAHVVGFTNVDDKGQEGLELAYNDWLSGEPGKKWVIKDRLGRIISDVRKVSDQRAGHDLVLSVDRRIQYLAYRELQAGVKENIARSGSVVVLDAKTGEVLAMVNMPSFNPNQRPIKTSENVRNRAVTDIFEPGSTMKAFSVATGLDSGRFKPTSIFDTNPGWIHVGHNIVKDHKNEGVLTLTQVLQKSSNIGVTKMILQLPSNHLWDLMHRVGFGEPTGIGFPGEQGGALVRHDPWGQFMLATLAFGYGMSATTLQLARAYDVFANEGVKLPVSLLRLQQQPTGERVLNKNVSRQTLKMLEAVVSKDAAWAAHVPGYRVAGKTGTAKIAANGGYKKHQYTSSFVGIAPASNPRLVVAVVIHDPQGKHYYGAEVSAPVFEKIMENALRILDIPPDEVKP